jgi:aminopeptidase C
MAENEASIYFLLSTFELDGGQIMAFIFTFVAHTFGVISKNILPN